MGYFRFTTLQLSVIFLYVIATVGYLLLLTFLFHLVICHMLALIHIGLVLVVIFLWGLVELIDPERKENTCTGIPVICFPRSKKRETYCRICRKRGVIK